MLTLGLGSSLLTSGLVAVEGFLWAFMSAIPFLSSTSLLESLGGTQGYGLGRINSYPY
jgi:hypothetical protein